MFLLVKTSSKMCRTRNGMTPLVALNSSMQTIASVKCGHTIRPQVDAAGAGRVEGRFIASTPAPAARRALGGPRFSQLRAQLAQRGRQLVAMRRAPRARRRPTLSAASPSRWISSGNTRRPRMMFGMPMDSTCTRAARQRKGQQARRDT